MIFSCCFSSWRFRASALVPAGALLLSGCDSPEIVVYEVPKDLAAAPSASSGGSRGTSGDPAERLGISHKAPAEWRDQGPDQMNFARFSIQTPQGSAGVNITPLAGMSGQEPVLVNMWRGALGQPELSPEEARTALRPVEIGTENGFMFEVGGASKSGPVAIVTAFAHRGGKSWFFKLQGDPPVVESQRQAFVDFLKTVRFEEPAGTTAEAAPAPAATQAPEPPAPEPEAAPVASPPAPAEAAASAPVDPTPAPVPVPPPVSPVETPDATPAPPDAPPPPAPEEQPPVAPPAEPAPAVEPPPAPSDQPPVPAPAAPLPEGLKDAAPQAASEVPGQPPADWTPVPTGPMQAAKFSLPEVEGAKAEVAVSVFGSDTGGVPSNVHRWRTQLGMPPGDEAAIRADIQKLEGGPEGAVFVALEHEGQGLTGAIVPRGERWFFYKMTGGAAAVRAARDSFLNFAKTPQ